MQDVYRIIDFINIKGSKGIYLLDSLDSLNLQIGDQVYDISGKSFEVI